MKTAQIVVAAVAALVIAGGGFAAGMTVGRNSANEAAASASPSGAGARGGSGAFVGRGAGGAGAPAGAQGVQVLAGRVLSVNDGSITLEVRQGGGQGASPAVSSQIVLVGTTTRVVKTTEQDIKLSDLKANDQIQILASTDATGQISANAIIAGGNALQQLFGGPGGPGGAFGGRGASPSPSPTR